MIIDNSLYASVNEPRFYDTDVDEIPKNFYNSNQSYPPETRMYRKFCINCETFFLDNNPFDDEMHNYCNAVDCRDAEALSIVQHEGLIKSLDKYKTSREGTYLCFSNCNCRNKTP